MAISNRLKTIAELVTPGYRAADIGTDHGYVPVYLLRNGISPFVIAADLSPGSLEKAREHAARAGFLFEETEDSLKEAVCGERQSSPSGICCRLSDGLSAFQPGEVDAIIISGMGGILMDRILRTGIEVTLSAKELILSPHRDAPLLRDFAKEFGLTIEEDFTITDKKKVYPIFKFKIPERENLS